MKSPKVSSNPNPQVIVKGEDEVVLVNKSLIKPKISVKSTSTGLIIDYDFIGFIKYRLRHNPFDGPMEFGPIKIPYAGFKVDDKKPLVPSFGCYVRIKHRKYDISYDFTNAYEYDLDYHLIASQEELTDTDITDPVDIDPRLSAFYDTALYSSKSPYPANSDMVKIFDSPLSINGEYYILVHIYPIQYVPSEQKLICHRNLEIKIEFESQTKEYPKYSLLNEGISNFCINPNLEGSRNTNSVISDDLEFLILFHPKFSKAAEKLEEQRNKLLERKDNRGLKTKSIDIRDPLGCLPDPDNEDFWMTENHIQDLQEYVRNYKKKNPKLRYVLLMGDYNHIKTNRFPHPDERYTHYPSDFYYSTIEPRSSDLNTALIPFLSVGRIPVSDEKTAVEVVEKIIDYEKNSTTDKKRVFFVGYFQDTDMRVGSIDVNAQECRLFIRTLEGIRNFLKEQHGFSDNDLPRVYVSECSMKEKQDKGPLKYLTGDKIPDDVVEAMKFSDYKDNPDIDKLEWASRITDRIVDEINKKPLLVAYRGHGRWNRLENPKFRKNDGVAGNILMNSNSILLCTTCLTGKFDVGCDDVSDIKNCNGFAEEMLLRKEGPVAVVAATAQSRTWRNDSLLNAMFDSLFEGYLPLFNDVDRIPITLNRIGDNLTYSKMYLPIYHDGLNYGTREHFEQYHLFGDPTMSIVN